MSGDAEQRVASGAAWRDFCRRLEAIGEIVLGARIADTPIDRAEGYRYLTRLTRIALDMHLENADSDFPGFYAASHPTAKIGADNPDNIYMNAAISGARTYRLTGNRGSVPILSFGTKADGLSADGDILSTGEIDIRAMAVDADGRFELIVARDPQPGNWLPIAPVDRFKLVLRLYDTPLTTGSQLAGVTMPRIIAGACS